MENYNGVELNEHVHEVVTRKFDISMFQSMDMVISTAHNMNTTPVYYDNPY